MLRDQQAPTGPALPLLITQNFGRGRAAIFATGGSWRWQMLQPLADKSHEMFYQQLLRWLVSDAPRKVTTSTPKPLISDDTHVTLRAEVLTYSRARGLFAGISLEGSSLRPDNGANEKVYNKKVEAEDIVRKGAVAVPPPAQELIGLLNKKSPKNLSDPASLKE